jgi:CRP/FNR family cyclic AMP-dependent transcriptional regulator
MRIGEMPLRAWRPEWLGSKCQVRYSPSLDWICAPDTMALSKSRLASSVDERSRLIADYRMFRTWPADAIRRLAESSRARSVPRGAALIPGGRVIDALVLVCEGSVEVSELSSDGRRATFKIARDGAYGLLPMLDGRNIPSGLSAIEPATVLEVPYSAVRAELGRDPGLWESVAIEAGVRARGYTDQLKALTFDAPRSRAASLLLGLAETSGEPTAAGVRIVLPLSQERLGEALGVSRQWVSAFVREMVLAGVVKWRYGRVTLIDPDGLRAIAKHGYKDKG